MKPLRYALLPLSALLLVPIAARADIDMTVTYYTIAESDPDMNGAVAGGVYNNEVQGMLGTDGLPVLNTTTYGCTSDCFTATPLPRDVTSDGEITWWSPGSNTDVTQTGTGTIALDAGDGYQYQNSNFYPPNGRGPNDNSGFQAAVFSSVLNVPTAESVSFSIGADDVGFLYLNGQIVCDLGGVHADSVGSCSSGVLSPGANTLELFYADLARSGAALTFQVNTTNITGSAPGASVPEPMSLTLLGTFLLGAGIARRRKTKGTSDPSAHRRGV
ncbi:MAG TPA: PEP-CTERM sorting domain-containing protein [Acetobacteraceae bacterium]|jgi:hypothetical protein